MIDVRGNEYKEEKDRNSLCLSSTEELHHSYWLLTKIIFLKLTKAFALT